MNCADYRGSVIECARGRLEAGERHALLVHVERCKDCAKLLAEQQALTAAEKRLRSGELPAAVEIGERVMAEFDRVRMPQRASVRPWRWVAAGLAAAALVLAILTPTPPAPPAPRKGGDDAAFLPIPYTVPLSPEERVEILRMEIPVTALISAGFRVGVSDPGAMVQADVLVSEDGRARAIRPLSVLNSN